MSTIKQLKSTINAVSEDRELSTGLHHRVAKQVIDYLKADHASGGGARPWENALEHWKEGHQDVGVWTNHHERVFNHLYNNAGPRKGVSNHAHAAKLLGHN